MNIKMSHKVYGPNVEELVNNAQRSCASFVGPSNLYGFEITHLDIEPYDDSILIGDVEVEYTIDPV